MASHRYSYRFVPADIGVALAGRYIVGDEIGSGGQGVVFRATRIFTPGGTPANDDIALKLHRYHNEDIRVQREIAAMGNISHPNMARLVEHGYFDMAGRRTSYLAWEFIEGQPLSVQLKSGPLLESEVLAIGRDVCAAIAEIWSQRIVHGDIKPSNVVLRHSEGPIMVGGVQSAVLIDLGAARYLDQDTIRTLRPSRDSDREESAAILRPLGTKGYFSPEQINGIRSLSCASDVFSLGIVMLQSLLGRHPTDYDQGPLVEGIQASGGKLAASAGTMRTLDKMLSPRPADRPNPAELSHTFQNLRQRMQAGLI
jgi:serine/threonine-protein kinase